MVQRGPKGLRASWKDVVEQIGRAREIADPPPEQDRDVNGDPVAPGGWFGAPADRLPPDCPVVPLGVNGKTAYFVDTNGQEVAVAASEWGKKILVHLFALQPNYLYWAWPRWSAPNKKTGRQSQINGLEVDDAVQCLVKAAARRGLYASGDRVRGRGAWRLKDGSLVWHAGEAIYRVENKRLTATAPGEIDGIIYPHKHATVTPWQEPIDPTDTPAHGIFAALQTWNFGRRVLDPVLVLGAIGAMFLGGALDFRPHLFAVGDKGVGKSTLQGLVKDILGEALHNSADTTPAGIYQRVGSDSLPVAIDELEATADNRRVAGVVALARLASSGAKMFRGGAEHTGVEFQLRNAFFFSAINPPPLEPAERSRMAFVNLGRVAADANRDAIRIKEADGRMILRALMDGWPRLCTLLVDWHAALAGCGLDQRGRDAYGTLLAIANVLLGDDAMEEAGVPVTEIARAAELVAAETDEDRAAATENWRGCLEFLLGSTIEAWRGGEKPSVGTTIELWESDIEALDGKAGCINERLQLVGLKGREEDWPDDHGGERSGWPGANRPKKRKLLYVPVASVGLEKVFGGSKWKGGVWASALRQAPPEVVIRDRGGRQNVKINRATVRCLIVDLGAYDRHVAEGG